MMPKIFLIALCLPLGLALPAFGARERIEVVTTDHADLPSGGLIHIEGSTGELNIAGWDQPTVEVTASRYTFQEQRDKQKYTDKLKAIDAVKMVSGNGGLTITTMRKRSYDVDVDYQIMVPRNARLVIRHHIGDVVVTNVGGDIDAKAGEGDIVVQLPDAEHYAINAKAGFGGVYSDFDEARHSFIGEKLIQDASTFDAKAGDAKGPSHKIDLHVNIGGISIQKMETAAPLATTPPAAGH